MSPNPAPSTQELLKQLLDGQKCIQQRLGAIESKLKKVDSIEKSVQCLKRRLVDLEDRSRRNDLIVFGIPESENETIDALNDKVVSDLFQNMLGINVRSVERLHRIGRRQPNKPHPVILKLFDRRGKISILKNCYKLKGKRMSVSEDFSAVTRQIRKQLWDSTAELCESGKKIRLVYDKIRIDNDLFVWDNEQMARVPVSRNRGRTRWKDE